MGVKTNEIIYMVLDELKLSSNDTYFTEDHILFLIDKWRAFILKQRYSDIKRYVPEDNYQSIEVDLIETPSKSIACMSTTYMSSTSTIPSFLYIGNTKVTSIDYFKGEFNLISKERFRYVGHNKFLQNMIYCTINDKSLYFKSNSLQIKYLTKVKVTAVFSSFIEVLNLTSDDVYDSICPIENSLVPTIVELVMKELSSSIYRPEDDINNSSDDFGKVNSNGE